MTQPPARLCASCGATVTAGRRFCSQCGQPMPAPPRFCERCGAQLPEGTRFCPQCGAPQGVAASAAPTGPAEPAHPQTAQRYAPPAPQPAVPQFAPITPQPPTAPARKRSAAVPIILVVMLLALLGGGYLWLKPKPGGGAARSTPTTAATGAAEQRPASTLQGEAFYASQPLVSSDTKPESKSLTTKANKAAELKLSDGTAVQVPALPQPIALTLSRESGAIDLGGGVSQTTGSGRVLTYQAADMTDFMPVVTIPAKEAGAIEAVSIVRQGPVVIEGTLVEDYLSVLPAQRDSAGNLVFIDTWMPLAPPTQAPQTMSPRRLWQDAEGLASRALLLKVSAQTSGKIMDKREAKYNVATYQDAINWKMKPKLVRMVPVPKGTSTAFRVPIGSLPKEQQRLELTKPVQNVVVLVHGHNEQERLGWDPPKSEEPWGYAYKRDVWTLLYEQVQASASTAISCTAFFEFIYPTYRPIFTSKGGGDPLGQALAVTLYDEPLIAQLSKAERDYNLYFVAHSMGGLVSRAGANALDSTLEKHFRKLVTWAAPYRGSPLVTLRYVLTEGYKLVGSYAPLPTMAQWQGYQDAVGSNVALDTPGERDLRWDNKRPLNLGGLGFEVSKAQSVYVDKNTDLQSSPMLYSADLRDFNERDKYIHMDKYYALYGITDKEVKVHSWFRDLWAAWGTLSPKKVVKQELEDNKIAIGNALIRWVYNNDGVLADNKGTPAVKGNDGAVSVDSALGAGVVRDANTRQMGTTDHEEFYGAPDKDGGLKNRPAGVAAASTTLDILALSEPLCSCPKLTLLRPKFQDTFPATPGITVPVEAKLDWLAVAKPWSTVKKVEAVLEVNQTKNLAIFPLTAPATGNLLGKIPAGQIGNGTHNLRVKLYFKDGSELLSEPAVPFTIFLMGVTEVRPTKGLPGDRAAIIGTSLGITGTVTINGVVAPVTEWRADMISIVVPTGAASGDLMVKVGTWTSDPMPFEVLTVLGILQKANAVMPDLDVWTTGEGVGSRAGEITDDWVWMRFRGGDLRSPGNLVWKGNSFEQIVSYLGDLEEKVTETVKGTLTPDGLMLATLSCSREGVMPYPPNDNSVDTLTRVYAFEAISIPLRVTSADTGSLGRFERGETTALIYFALESPDIAQYITSASYSYIDLSVPKNPALPRDERGFRAKTWEYTSSQYKASLRIRFEYRK